MRHGRATWQIALYSLTSIATAQRWFDEGARRLHIVDLDGAFAGGRQRRHNRSDLKSVANPTDSIGGGIRCLETIALSAGVEFAVIGTMAVRNRTSFIKRARLFRGRLLSASMPAGRWLLRAGRASELDATDLAKCFAGAGVSAMVYTDIGRDGMMQGVNVEATVA